MVFFYFGPLAVMVYYEAWRLDQEYQTMTMLKDELSSYDIYVEIVAEVTLANVILSDIMYSNLKATDISGTVGERHLRSDQRLDHDKETMVLELKVPINNALNDPLPDESSTIDRTSRSSKSTVASQGSEFESNYCEETKSWAMILGIFALSTATLAVFMYAQPKSAPSNLSMESVGLNGHPCPWEQNND